MCSGAGAPTITVYFKFQDSALTFYFTLFLVWETNPQQLGILEETKCRIHVRRKRGFCCQILTSSDPQMDPSTSYLPSKSHHFHLYSRVGTDLFHIDIVKARSHGAFVTPS